MRCTILKKNLRKTYFEFQEYSNHSKSSLRRHGHAKYISEWKAFGVYVGIFYIVHLMIFYFDHLVGIRS